MVKEFREFVVRGNVIDLAVAVVIGAAFGAVVTSLVENLLTPLIAIPGTTDFSALDFTISGSTFRYGLFLNSLIAFLAIAGAVFFFVVRPLTHMLERRRAGEIDLEPTERECPECLSTIPTRATRCAHCTSEVPASVPR